jgi:hypothetical protein
LRTIESGTGVMSRTRDIVTKITQIIQDIGLIRSNNTKTTKKNYKFKPGRKGLRHKHSPERTDNDERSGEGYGHFEDSKNTPELRDLPSNPYSPTHHETSCHASLVSRPTRPRSLMRTHTGLGDPPLPPSISSEPDVTCRTDDNVDQNESSDSCGSSSSGSSPPSGELGQDSREGMEGEERPDPGGGEGMTGDLQGGSVQ